MHVFLFSPLNVNAERKLYASNQQKQMLFLGEMMNFTKISLLGNMKNETIIFPTGNE